MCATEYQSPTTKTLQRCICDIVLEGLSQDNQIECSNVSANKVREVVCGFQGGKIEETECDKQIQEKTSLWRGGERYSDADITFLKTACIASMESVQLVAETVGNFSKGSFDGHFQDEERDAFIAVATKAAHRRLKGERSELVFDEVKEVLRAVNYREGMDFEKAIKSRVGRGKVDDVL